MSVLKPPLLYMISHSPEETAQIAATVYQKYLCRHLRLLLLLEGSLGAGKTCFVRALGASLGIQQNINSPSFLLLNTYSGEKWDIYHYDLYRLHSPLELEQLDFRERWSWSPAKGRQFLHAIEWPRIAHSFFPQHIPTYRLEIQWAGENEEDTRILQLYDASG